MLEQLNICHPLPGYIADGDATLLQQELSMIIMYTFADLNMAVRAVLGVLTKIN